MSNHATIAGLKLLMKQTKSQANYAYYQSLLRKLDPNVTPQVTKADYQVLKDYGFSAAKASEIVLDAGRGDRLAIEVIKIAKTRETK